MRFLQEPINIINYFREVANIFKRQEKAFKVNVIRVVFVHFFIYLVLPLQSIYVVGRGLSPSQLGWVTGFAGIIGGTLSFLAARKIKTTSFSLKSYFLTTTMCIGIGSIILAIANGPIMAAVGIGTFMLSWYAMMHLCPAVCGLCLTNDIRATAMQTCDMFASIPKVIGPAIGSALVLTLGGKQDVTKGIPFLYYISALGFCLTFIIIWRWFSDPSYLMKTRNINNKRKDIKESGRSIISDLLKRKNGINLKLLLITLALIQVPWFIMNIYVPLFAQQVKRADALTIGLMQSAFWACTLLLAIPAGRLADRIGRKSSITIFLVISIASFSLLIIAKSQLILIISGFFQGFLFFSLVTSSGMSAEAVGKMSIVEWMGLQGFLKGLMAQLGPVISGTLWSIFGPYSIVYLLIGCQLVAITLLRMLPETQNNLIDNELSVTKDKIVNENI